MSRRAQSSLRETSAVLEIRYRTFSTPLFDALFATTPHGLCYVSLARDLAGLEHWRDRFEPSAALVNDRRLEPRFVEAARDYARGRDADFGVFEIDQRGTVFQLKVWNELVRIPHGTTRTYAEIAQRIGQPTAVRAVGRANGANALPLVVPCHRVVAVNGLGGFTVAGCIGGVEVKRALLEREGVLIPAR